MPSWACATSLSLLLVIPYPDGIEQIYISELRFTTQISMLRKMMCLLTCQPGDDTDNQVDQALGCLAEMLNLAAAGLCWKGGQQAVSCAQRPLHFILDPHTQASIADPAHLDEVLEGNGSVSWLAVPMMADGVAQGRLWVAALPERVFGDDERELLRTVANQLALARRNAVLVNELKTMAERRGTLLRRFIELQEDCQRNVSRELHDEVSQSLTALIVQIDTLLAAHAAGAELQREKLDRLRGEVVRVLDEVNRMVLDLRPTMLESHGLMAALRWYGSERLVSVGTQFLVSGGRCAPQLPSPLLTTLYRIGQQAIANVARHAGAANAWLDISCQDHHLVLTVQDDGEGFDVPSVLSWPQGMSGIGISGMQERAALVNGELTIESELGRGTCVKVTVPYTCKVIDE